MLLQLLVLVLSSAFGHVESQQLCQPQGMLRLEQPYSSPQLQTLPFCSQYKCSCCRTSHALAIKRLLLKDADGMSQLCMEALTMLACRVCDPEVGMGAKSAICAPVCDSAYTACQDDFFGWHESSGLVVPCGGRDAQLLVCSKLLEVVNDGAQFCAAAGYEVGNEQPCFDGSYVGNELCPEREPPVRPKRQRKAKSIGSSIQAWLDQIDLQVLTAVVVLSGMVSMAAFRLWLSSRQLQDTHNVPTQQDLMVQQRREQLLKAVNDRAHIDSPRSSSGGDAELSGTDSGVSLIGSGTGAHTRSAKKRR